MEEKENLTTKSDDEFIQESESKTQSNMLTFKRTHVYAALLPLAFVTGLAVGFMLWGRATAVVPPPATKQAAVVPDEQPQEVRRYDIPEDDDPVYGPENAPITIIEFSDYECPYCRKWHIEVLPRLMETYPDQIRLVYRDFPLTKIHANATPAASAANCAGEQDQYWEFSDMLFSMRLELSIPSYQTYAEQLELDLDDFNECLESRRHNSEVMADFEYAANLGISSTPTFFVNGIPVVGAQPYEVFAQLINQELAGEIPETP